MILEINAADAIRFDELDKAKPMSVNEALAERDRIEAQIEQLLEARHKRGPQVAKIEAELKQLYQDQETEEQAAAFGGELDQTKADRIAQLNEELETLGRIHQASKPVERELKLELHVLHMKQGAAFAEHADQLGAEAVELTAKIRKQYEKAYDAWQRSLGEWDRVTSHYNLGRTRGSNNTLAQLTVAPSPLAPPALVFGAQAPRPVEVPGTGVHHDNPLTRKADQ